MVGLALTIAWPMAILPVGRQPGAAGYGPTVRSQTP
jgi:hypothetical protein